VGVIDVDEDTSEVLENVDVGECVHEQEVDDFGVKLGVMESVFPPVEMGDGVCVVDRMIVSVFTDVGLDVLVA
jgi:hypothetical protein